MNSFEKGQSPLFFLVGPTAVGKTAPRARLGGGARGGDPQLRCVLRLQRDGRGHGQAHGRGAEERVRHHGIDVVSAATPSPYSGGGLHAARGRRGRGCVVTGPSPFGGGRERLLLEEFFSAVVDKVAVSAESGNGSATFWRRRASKGVGRVEEAESRRPRRPDIRNPRRVARARERCLAFEFTLAELEGKATLEGACDPPGVAGYRGREAGGIQPPQLFQRPFEALRLQKVADRSRIPRSPPLCPQRRRKKLFK